MFELVSATVYALVLSVPISFGVGFFYYFLCMGVMSLLRRVLGEEHRGYYMLNVGLLCLAATFFLLFAFFARSF